MPLILGMSFRIHFGIYKKQKDAETSSARRSKKCIIDLTLICFEKGLQLFCNPFFML